MAIAVSVPIDVIPRRKEQERVLEKFETDKVNFYYNHYNEILLMYL